MTETQAGPLTLRDIALKASDRFGGVRGRALGREAEKAGVTITYTTIDKIISGTYTSRPTDATLRALAQLALVPIEDVYRAADQPLPQARFADQLPAGVDNLTPAQREAVLTLIRQFIAQNREAHQLRNMIVHSGSGSGKTEALLLMQAIIERVVAENGGELPSWVLTDTAWLDAWLRTDDPEPATDSSPQAKLLRIGERTSESSGGADAAIAADEQSVSPHDEAEETESST